MGCIESVENVSRARESKKSKSTMLELIPEEASHL